VDDGTAHRGPVRVGAVDDHPAILSGLLAGLSQPPRTFVCAVAETVAELLDFGAAMDIVLLDLRLADDSDPETNVHTLIEHGLPVLLYTQERRQPLVARALQAGASGVVGKHEPMSTLAQAVSRVVDGGVWFSAEWAEAIRSGIGPRARSPRDRGHHPVCRGVATQIGRHPNGPVPGDGQAVPQPVPGEVCRGGPTGSDQDRALPPGHRRRLPRSALTGDSPDRRRLNLCRYGR
jgi:DNA-binding NarL/FixJ family response regulator